MLNQYLARLLLLSTSSLLLAQTPVRWTHISSATGEIPLPFAEPEPTASLIVDVDKDGRQDFIIGSRINGPSVVLYRGGPSGWTQCVIDSSVQQIEAGGAIHDIDGDGDLDIVFGGDARSNEIWWWENPYPNFDPKTNWTRRPIKKSGGRKHHDQIFGDFDHDGKVELVSWNQGAKQLLLFEIPADPKDAIEWPQKVIYSWESGPEHEGLAAADINGDGKVDLAGGGRWFEYAGEGRFTAHLIDDSYRFSRVIAGQFKRGGRAQVVFGPGDNMLRLKLFEWEGDSWKSRDLMPQDVNHGHSLQAGDVDGDGNLDVFCGEMAQWGPKAKPPDNPNAHLWVLYGDGQGNFAPQLVDMGQGTHEAKLGDLDGDGRLDILGKPFRHHTPRLDVYFNRGSPRVSGKASLDKWQRHVIDDHKPWRAIFITSGDIDGDGKRDIITGGWWYRNPGSPGAAWQRNTIGPALKNMAAALDFDYDGDLDILGTGGEGSEANDHFVWARNDGSGRFSILDNISEAQGDFLQGVTVARFSPQNHLGVALSWHHAGNGVQILTVPRDAATEAWDWRKISDFSQDEQLSAGDIDRDGDMDLLLGTRWLRNDGDSWSLHTIHGSAGDPDRNRLADINGDGRLDAIVGFEAINKPGKLAWYEQGPSAPGLWAEHVLAEPVGPMSLDVADMDGDGDLDVVVGEHNYENPSTARLLVFENLDGMGVSWKPHVVYTGDEHHDGTQLVDIDGDGDLDIISIGWSHPRVLLYENRTK
jgi:hypothetical protein